MESDQGPSCKKSKVEPRCVRCLLLIRKLAGTPRIIKSREDAVDFFERFKIFVQEGDAICQRCFSNIRLQKSLETASRSSTTVCQPETVHEASPQEQQTVPESSPSLTSSQSSISPSSQSSTDDPTYVPPVQPQSEETVTLSFNRTIITHGYCFICKGKNNLKIVPLEARLQAFVRRRIFIPKGNRCCSSHIIKKRFFEDEIPKLTVYCNESEVEVGEISLFLDELSNQAIAELHDRIGIYGITDERIKALTGYSWVEVEKIEKLLVPMKKSSNRNVIQALIMFLYKLRSGNSDNLIGASLGIEERIVTESIHSVLNCFENFVLKNNFGLNVYTRDTLINETAPIAKRLHHVEDDTLVLIYDGTYVRHGKSANNTYQRKSFSGHKKTSLCKPFTVCTTNGFLVDVLGPFPATQNDASIMKHVLEEPQGISKLLRKGDIFVLDRGFRDVKDFLEQKGYTVLMPALQGSDVQLSTTDANCSRLVTKLRWVVEAIHGIIGQKWKLLHNQLHNSLLKSLATYCKVACFLQNYLGKRLNSDITELDTVVERIQSSLSCVNSLAEEVEANNWARKTQPFHPWTSDELPDFPELTLEQLRLFFTGSYQLKQAISYLAEMMKEEDHLQLLYLKENVNILRFEVQSRHINRQKYKVFVDYEPNSTSIDGVKRYCCTCKNGRRTVGCCSHVAAIIYYLSYARFLSSILRPAEILTRLFDFEEVNVVIPDESDDDD